MIYNLISIWIELSCINLQKWDGVCDRMAFLSVDGMFFNKNSQLRRTL